MKRLTLLILMALVIFLFPMTPYFYNLYLKKRSEHLRKIPIQMIAQTGPEKEGLKTDCLAEILELSIENSKAMFEEKKGRGALLKNPLIARAKIELIAPGILSIDYTLRKPYVFLGDYQNLALDREGYPFPFSPFYTPKNIPLVYLGPQEVKWGCPVKNKTLAFEILNFIEAEMGLEEVESLDISKAEHHSLGRREIVVVFKKKEKRHFLRLTPLRYSNELRRYRLLNCEKEEGDLMIDLRLPNLAFIKENKDV